MKVSFNFLWSFNLNFGIFDEIFLKVAKTDGRKIFCLCFFFFFIFASKSPRFPSPRFVTVSQLFLMPSSQTIEENNLFKKMNYLSKRRTKEEDEGEKELNPDR